MSALREVEEETEEKSWSDDDIGRRNNNVLNTNSENQNLIINNPYNNPTKGYKKYYHHKSGDVHKRKIKDFYQRPIGINDVVCLIDKKGVYIELQNKYKFTPESIRIMKMNKGRGVVQDSRRFNFWILFKPHHYFWIPKHVVRLLDNRQHRRMSTDPREVIPRLNKNTRREKKKYRKTLIHMENMQNTKLK
eukprot:UN23253